MSYHIFMHFQERFTNQMKLTTVHLAVTSSFTGIFL